MISQFMLVQDFLEEPAPAWIWLIQILAFLAILAGAYAMGKPKGN